MRCHVFQSLRLSDLPRLVGCWVAVHSCVRRGLTPSESSRVWVLGGTDGWPSEEVSTSGY